MKKNLTLILAIFFIKFLFSDISQNGDIKGGFSSNLLEKILYDPISQKIYLATQNPLISNRNFGISSMSIYSNGTSPLNGIISNYCFLNTAKAENPLLNIGFSDFELIPLTIYGRIMNLLILVSSDKKSIFLFDKNFKSFNQYEINNLIKLEAKDFLDNNGKVLKIFGNLDELNVLCCSDGKNFEDDDSNSVLRKYTIRFENGFFNIIKESKIKFDKTIPAFNSNSGILTIQNNSLLSYSDPYLNTGFFAISGSGTNGIKSISCENYELVSDGTFGTDNIIASTTQPIYIKNISTIKTSTNLSYLISQCGYSQNNSLRKIYALPLVNDPKSFDFKKLADVTLFPEERFSNTGSKQYIGNYFSKAAESENQLYKSTSKKAMVGRNFTHENDDSLSVKSIQGSRDTVFVKTVSNDPDVYGGVFYSQALFDEKKAISYWTNWQRKGFIDSSSNPISGNIFLIPDGSFLKIFNDTTRNLAFVTKTIWSQNSVLNLIFLNYLDELNLKKSGIQGIVDIPYNHPFTDTNVNFPSFCMLFGNNSVIIKQTSEAGNSKPIISEKIFFNKNGSTEGFDSAENYTCLIFSNGELNGPIITGCLSYSNDDCWFIAGGSNGVFILSKENGEGFGDTGVGSKFSYLDSSFKWKKVSNLKNVRKIIPLENWVFILTNDSLYRANNDFTSVIKLFDNESYPFKNAKMSDFAVSENSCLLGTTVGLFRNSNENSITSNSRPGWTKIDLPESNFPPISIFTISRDGLANTWASANDKDSVSGNIYVLASSLATSESFIYRFASYSTKNDGFISENSIIPIENHFIENVPSYFLRTLPNRLNISGDGASWFLQGIQSFSEGYFGDLSIFDGKISEGFPFPINKNSKTFPSIKNANIGPANFISGYGIWAAQSIFGIYTLE